ncbi:MAG TPA: phospholipase D-like domain-containing protein [Nevskiaceae bacterium]|nr:phospholipase D-like domain-containing protein [Nevskiaceae bacterium]
MSALLHWLQPYWLALYAAAALAAAMHALLHKRDPRSAWAWIAMCWLFPLGGAALYWLIGINRVEGYARLGSARRRRGGWRGHSRSLRELEHAGASAGGNPLLPGNSVELLVNGEQAYPAMLEAIAAARESIYLATYIYCDDDTGRRFAQALAQAHERGVRVRVLLDGVSDFFYRPRASRLLAQLRVPYARFLPLRAWPPMLHVNLRNHRKLLVVDGRVAFTGGMNVAEYHLLKSRAQAPVADLQFRIRGPLVQQLEDVFRADWQFASGEALAPSPAPAADDAPGTAACRVITDGPENERDPFMLVLIAALAAAHRRVCIMTPYFLPPAPVAAALEATALRGIEVRIVLPLRSDQPWIDWATRHALAPLLRHGVQLYFGPPPFAHTKLLLVDDQYVQFGSANLDVRSLRLNFELNVECYDAALSAQLHRHFDAHVRGARCVRVAQLTARPLPARLRDAFFWLFSPYL